MFSFPHSSIADFYVSFPSVSSVKMEVTKTNADEINAARQPDAQVPSVQSASGSNIQSATTIQLPIIRRNSQDPTNGPTNLHDEEDTPSKPLPTPTPSPMKPRWASGSTKAAATAASVIAAAASAAVAVAAAAAVAASLMSSENSSVSSQSSSSQPPESPSKRRGRPSSSKYVPKHTFQLQKPAVSLFSVIAPSSTPARYPTSASSETEHDLQSDSDVVPMKDEICTEKESPNTDIAENQGRPMTTRAADSNSAKPLIRAASASDSSTASVTVSDTFNDEAVWRTEAKTTSHQVRIPFGSNSAVSPVKVRRQNALTAKSRKLTDAVALLKAQRRAEAEGLTTLLKSRVGVLGNYGAELRRFVVGSGDGANGEDGEHDGYENVHGDRMDVLEDEWGNQYDGDHSTAEEGLADRPVETSDLKNPVQSSAQSDREKRKRSAHSLNESDSGKRARRGVPRNNDTESAAQPSRKKQRTANSASRNTAAVDPFPAFSSVPKYGRRRTSIGGGDSTAATLDLTVLLSTAVELLNETDPTSKITAQPVLIGAATKKRTASDLSASEEGNDSQPRSSGLDLLALLAADGLF
ncbi:hypothetical protein BJ741DRAFT_590131 [Chytriomyces cf. hyalinus JEL632]|nr:hypothetical protein BJ741DRAFT_590131 [Chytriomyces cf. hyalinus JEL632]